MSVPLAFHALEEPRGPVFDAIVAIYNEAFPDDQRMSDGRIASLVERGHYRLIHCTSDERVVGFAIVLRPPESRFCWLEYFAVDRGQRGGGIGSTLFQWTARTVSHGLDGMLLEVEKPQEACDPADRATRLKRIEFYRRLDCVALPDFPYVMWTPTGGMPMLLLVYPGELQLPVDQQQRSQLYAGLHQAVADRRMFYEGWTRERQASIAART